MDGLIKTEVADVEAVLGRAWCTAEPAADGMSVEVQMYGLEGSAGKRLRAASEMIDRIRAAGYWVADTGTYWSATAADLIADGKPVWVGRTA